MNFLFSDLLLLVLSTCLLVGCGKKDGNTPQKLSKETEELTPTPVEQGKELNIDLKVERIVRPLSDLSNFEEVKKSLNTYSVTFKSKKERYPYAQVSCFKMNFDEKKNYRNWALDEEGKKAEFIFELEKYDPVEVKYLCVVSAEGKEQKTFEFSLKKSFIITGKTDIMKAGIGNEASIGLLIFDQDAVLSTGGRFVKLNAEGIVSNNGQLLTLSDEEVANTKTDTNGVEGGRIEIETKELTGSLQIELRGANGGKSTKIAEDMNSPAKTGANGGTYLHGCWNKQLPTDFWCEGKNGEDGVKGNPGYPGQNGGNSGSINFIIGQLSTNASLGLSFNPGKGSKGTLGGKGQPGGDGGKGVTVNWETYSGRGENTQYHKLVFKDGKQGRNGDRGDSGKDGLNGRIITSSVQIGEEIFPITSNWNK